ncbi:hypothetical protein GJ688_17095 [Heliobacillus mobilis]|uniref:Uncharacterized protein n=1 Tax=Heliobacterium mobile TaxID=28064 RepID=A0A6I3SPN8_HELMO|nr:hypothetical protein [Heliobacterium mobile]MTV50655.1 hypothetical protein [Heliobacterium mobile]
MVIGTFEHSLELEQALSLLEHDGIARKHILVILMDTDPKNPNQFLSKPTDLYPNAIEVGTAFATACAVIGTSVGFKLAWGPIFSGLSAAVGGFIVGFGLYLFVKKGIHKTRSKRLPEICVIVQCTEEQVELVTETLWKFGVLTVGRVKEPSLRA